MCTWISVQIRISAHPLHICAYTLRLFSCCVRLWCTIDYAKRYTKDIVYAYKKSFSLVEKNKNKNTFCDIDNRVWLVGKIEIISSRYQWKPYQREVYSKTFARHSIPLMGLTATTHDLGPLSSIPCCLIVPPAWWSLYDSFRCYSYFYPLFDFLSNELHTSERSNPPFN